MPLDLLRHRPAVGLAVLVAIVAWLASGAAVLRSARDEAAVAEQRQLETIARLLLQLTVTDGATPIALSPANGYRHPWRYQVWAHDGTLLRTNHLRSQAPFTPLERGRSVHGTAEIDATAHRVFAAWNADASRQVQVAQRDEPPGLALDRVPVALLALFAVCSALLILLLLALTAVALRAPSSPAPAGNGPRSRFGPPHLQR